MSSAGPSGRRTPSWGHDARPTRHPVTSHLRDRLLETRSSRSMSLCHSLRRSRFALLGGTRQHKARAGLTRRQPGLEALEERRLLSGGPPTFPEHYPNIRIAELAYSNSPPDSTEVQLLQSSVDLVVPDVSQLSAI